MEQYTEAIKTYWKDTSISLEQNSSALKEKYDIEIKNLEIETQKNPEYFIKKAKKLSS